MSSSTRRIRKRLAAGTFAGVLGVSGVAALAPAASAKDFVQAVNTTANLTAANVGGSARLSGANRYATAAAVAVATYPSGGRGDVLLASGVNFPDGLAGAGLAGFVDSPLLLTDTATLPSETINALATVTAGNPAKRVHILGGTSAISQAVRDQLKALGYTLVENYNGANRYDTAAKIAAAIGGGNIGAIAGKRTAILATGTNYADALSGGAAAFAGRFPIILTDTATLSVEAKTALTTLGITRVIVLGGTAAVSQATEDAVKAAIPGISVDRQAGANRADTAAKLANYADANLATLGFNKTRVVLFNGYTSFADGLSAGPHAGKIGANLLPVGSVPAETAAYLSTNSATLNVVQGVGGPAVIDDATLAGAISSATLAGPTATILAGAGATAFQVKYTADVTTGGGANAADLVGNYQLLSASGSLTAGSVIYNSATRTATVILGSGFVAPGDTIRLTPSVANPTLSNILANGSATVFVPVAQVSVAPDTTAPVATIRATAGGGNTKFTVTFTETVTGLAPGDFVMNNGNSVASLVADAALPFRYIVTATNPLVQGDTIQLNQAAVTDGVALPNAQVGPISVVGDSAPPTASAAVTIATSGRDALVLTGPGSSLLVTATVASGDSGVSVQVAAAGVPTAPAVTVVGRAITITLGATAGSNSPAAISALLSGNAAAAALVTPSNVSGTADLAVVAATPLPGGTTNASVAITLSETVRAFAAGDIQIYRDGDVGNGAGANLINVPLSAVPTGGPLIISGATALGVSPISVLRVTPALTDLAGNFNASALNTPVTLAS